jgi:hypothetical protein
MEEPKVSVYQADQVEALPNGRYLYTCSRRPGFQVSGSSADRLITLTVIEHPDGSSFERIHVTPGEGTEEPT